MAYAHLTLASSAITHSLKRQIETNAGATQKRINKSIMFRSAALFAIVALVEVSSKWAGKRSDAVMLIKF